VNLDARMDAHAEPPTEMHWKRGRWYAVDQWEFCIVETTIRGFRVLKRPAIDTNPPTGVELAADRKPTS